MTETPKTQFELHIDINALTLGDAEKLESSGTSMTDVLDILQRIMPDEDVRALRLSMIPDIKKAIARKVSEWADSKN